MIFLLIFLIIPSANFLELQCEGLIKLGGECDVGSSLKITSKDDRKITELRYDQQKDKKAEFGEKCREIRFERLTMNFFPVDLELFIKNPQIIYIQDCDLLELTQDDLKPFQMLQHLIVTGNKNFKKLPADLFNTHWRLSHLLLDRNGIEEVEQGAFDPLSLLKVLDFEENSCASGRADHRKDVVAFSFEIYEKCKKVGGESGKQLKSSRGNWLPEIGTNLGGQWKPETSMNSTRAKTNLLPEIGTNLGGHWKPETSMNSSGTKSNFLPEIGPNLGGHYKPETSMNISKTKSNFLPEIGPNIGGQWKPEISMNSTKTKSNWLPEIGGNLGGTWKPEISMNISGQGWKSDRSINGLKPETGIFSSLGSNGTYGINSISKNNIAIMSKSSRNDTKKLSKCAKKRQKGALSDFISHIRMRGWRKNIYD